ncbi:MAG: hypothetical protein M1818_000815 [Claussenomyces sp. TS43310]|nr:MAG: hypothetical protein M1818_000815 [Claussenomyces sp. TS43310]
MSSSSMSVLRRQLRYFSGRRFSTACCGVTTLHKYSFVASGTRSFATALNDEAGKTRNLIRHVTVLARDLPHRNGVQPDLFERARRNPLWLRDSCSCPRCVDPSTSQKLFQTSDIPLDISVATEKASKDTYEVTWKNDVVGFDGQHVSTYSRDFLDAYSKPHWISGIDGFGRPDKGRIERELWNKDEISERIKFIDYNEYLSSEEALHDALIQLTWSGLVFIRGIPDKSDAVEAIGGRIGHLRDTFYGRTWDVKSVPQAKNVAYTSQFLGFHMDLLYKSDPPGLQLLHCLRNSCEGGASMFSDSFLAADELRKEDFQAWFLLTRFNVQYHYHNDGEHYRHSRPVIELSGKNSKRPAFVNWSPPFQAPSDVGISPHDQDVGMKRPLFASYARAAKKFAAHIENPANIFEHRLQEGECVIFNNRRVLHARRAFESTSGQRWLKGAYLDTDVFLSRYRVLQEKWGPSTPPDISAQQDRQL